MLTRGGAVQAFSLRNVEVPHHTASAHSRTAQPVPQKMSEPPKSSPNELRTASTMCRKGMKSLARSSQSGPIVIEEYEGTVVVPPDCLAFRDGYGNIVIDLPSTNS